MKWDWHTCLTANIGAEPCSAEDEDTKSLQGSLADDRLSIIRDPKHRVQLAHAVFVSILIDTNIQLNQNLKTSTMSSGSSRWYG